MSLDRASLAAAVAAHGRVVRVVVADFAGSAPRETGAAMLVWPGGQEGTIGGGALEWQAARAARALLESGGGPRLERHALGPGLGQCCGGAVTLLSEVWDGAALAGLPESGAFARPVAADAPAEASLAMRRLRNAARSGGPAPAPQLAGGWMVEPLAPAARPLWVWGAGHVGRAIVGVLQPLPDFALTWIDSAAARFPETVPAGVDRLIAENPADLVAYAPAEAAHLVLTYSHALDLELCHRLLGHGFASLGLIGSATKRARFRSRLGRLGHPPARIGRIACPIGDPALGKHPQAIALGVASTLLREGREAAEPRAEAE